MILQKQIISLYNTARIWVAGAWKGSMFLDDDPGSKYKVVFKAISEYESNIKESSRHPKESLHTKCNDNIAGHSIHAAFVDNISTFTGVSKPKHVEHGLHDRSQDVSAENRTPNIQCDNKLPFAGGEIILRLLDPCRCSIGEMIKGDIGGHFMVSNSGTPCSSRQNKNKNVINDSLHTPRTGGDCCIRSKDSSTRYTRKLDAETCSACIYPDADKALKAADHEDIRNKLRVQRAASGINNQEIKVHVHNHQRCCPGRSSPYAHETCNDFTRLRGSGYSDFNLNTRKSYDQKIESQCNVSLEVTKKRNTVRYYGKNNNGETIGNICNILDRLRWDENAELALYSLNTKINPVIVNEILKQQKEVKPALKFFKWAKEQKCYKHDVHTYTTMVGILGRAQMFDAALDLLDDMKADGCKPSVVTFNRLIHSYGKANKMAEADTVFHHMKSVGCIPDKVTYCTLIDLHAKAGSLDVAVDMYRQMQQAGLEPDTFAYSVMINCLGKAGEVSAAHQILDEMIVKGYTPNLVTYNILIDLYAKSGKYDMALQIYNDIVQKGYHPDHVTYNIVMEVLGHTGCPEKAELVFKEMVKAGWAPDATAYGLLVDIWGRAGNSNKACRWYNQMATAGIKPNVPTYNSLLGAFLREESYDAANNVLENMKSHGLAPSLQTYTLLLSCYTLCGRTESCGRIWDMMISLEHAAHTFICSFPVVKYGENVARRHATHLFAMIRCESQESKRSFTDATINFLHNFNMKEEAAIVWQVGAEKNVYPKAVTCNAAKQWTINLHFMSMGTAIIALSQILSCLKEKMMATGVMPEKINIITGWGRRSQVRGSSIVKQTVERLLNAMGSPFHLERGNLGCFVGMGQSLADWLCEYEAHNMYLI